MLPEGVALGVAVGFCPGRLDVGLVVWVWVLGLWFGGWGTRKLKRLNWHWKCWKSCCCRCCCRNRGGAVKAPGLQEGRLRLAWVLLLAWMLLLVWMVLWAWVLLLAWMVLSALCPGLAVVLR